MSVFACCYACTFFTPVRKVCNSLNYCIVYGYCSKFKKIVTEIECCEFFKSKLYNLKEKERGELKRVK